jgi:hypothetical protein
VKLWPFRPPFCYNDLVIVEAGLALLAIGAAAKLIQSRRRTPVTGTPAAGTPAGGSQPTAGTVTIRNRVVTGPTGATYTLTDDDLLWLARAVKGEAGTSARGGAAVAWAMAQNYMTTGPGSGPRFAALPTFTALLRGYCQPINPIWADVNAAGCRRNPAACTPNLIARRRAIATMPWSAIPQSIRDLVTSFATGTLPNPIPGLTDWATPRWGADNIEIDGNFFGRKQPRRRPA